MGKEKEENRLKRKPKKGFSLCEKGKRGLRKKVQPLEKKKKEQGLINTNMRGEKGNPPNWKKGGLFF